MPVRGDNIRKRKNNRREVPLVKRGCETAAQKYRSACEKRCVEEAIKRVKISKYTPQFSTANDLPFKEILEAWQASNRIRLKEASVSRYQNLIDAHILPVLGNKRMSQLSAAMINHFLASKLENGRLDGTGGLSASYVRSITLVIGSAIRFGAEENLCRPLRSPLSKPSLSKKEFTILNTEKQAMLEAELLDDMREEKLLIYLTLYTGLRIGEVCALRWEDIDLEAKLLYVRQTVSRVWHKENNKKHSQLVVGPPKTKSSLRCIPICSKLYPVLCGFPYRKLYGYILFSDNKDGFTSPRTFEYRFKKVVKAAGLPPINYHALRHTFATRCIECGVDIKTLSEILGHANTSVTLNTYVHSSIELKRLQLEKLAS